MCWYLLWLKLGRDGANLVGLPYFSLTSELLFYVTDLGPDSSLRIGA